MHASTVAFTLFATAQVLAAPTPAGNKNEARSLSAIGDAIGNFAEDVLGPHVGKRSASNVLGRAEPSDLMVDTETGTIYMNVPDANGARSLKAVGAAVAGGVASGVAGAVASNVLGRSVGDGDLTDVPVGPTIVPCKRDLMVDTETGTIYMDVPDASSDKRSLTAIGNFISGIFNKREVEERSLKAVGAAVAGGVASGVAGAAASSILGRDEPSGLMVDTDTGILYMDVADDASDKRSLTAIGNFISGIFNKRDVPEERSLKAVGAAVAGGVASGVAGAVASNVLGRDEPSGLMVDTDTGVIYMDVADESSDKRSFTAIGNFISGIFNKRDVDALEARSLKAVGAAVAGGVASGVAGAVASNVLGRDVPSGLMVGTDTGVIYMDVADDSADKRSLTAIGNFISGIFNKRDGGSAEAVNHQIKQVLQRSELAEAMAKRSIDDLE